MRFLTDHLHQSFQGLFLEALGVELRNFCGNPNILGISSLSMSKLRNIDRLWGQEFPGQD